MGRVNFTQIWSPNEEVTRLQSHIKTTLNPLLELPISDGVLIKDLSIATSDTLVEHKLGRDYEGFIITRLKTNSVILKATRQMILRTGRLFSKPAPRQRQTFISTRGRR